ncbi:type III-A CRISPR-associated protein Csm2 [bacterium]|nr:type III-A CRISPR-associated protein Csm2 [bacterium]
MSFERERGSAQQQGSDVYRECKAFLAGLKNLKEAPAEKLISYLDLMGNDLAKRVKIAQLRKVLDAFEKIRSATRLGKEKLNLREETQPLKIHLAYAAGRERSLKPLQDVLQVAIDKVYDIDDFKKLAQFIEGLIAYHKFYGGE